MIAFKVQKKILDIISENYNHHHNEFIAGETYIPVTQKYIDKDDIINLTKSKFHTLWKY